MSWAIWITGRSGSGKSTLAAHVVEALSRWPIAFKVLDLAAARQAIVGKRWATEPEEEMVHRALAYTAKLLTEAGVVVVVDATAPRRAWRDTARRWITHFAEVQLVCPPDLCAVREQAARWGLSGARAVAAASSAPELALDYEEALCPELRLHTHGPELMTRVEEVVLLARRLHHAAAASPIASGRNRS